MSTTPNINLSSEAMPVGDGFAVTFFMKAGRLDCEWSPRVPKGRKARRYLPAYRLARNEFIRRLSARAGIVIGVIEL
jgi:hypothetical protein